MKINLIIVMLLATCPAQRAEESPNLAQMDRTRWLRVQTEFRIVKHLDARQFSEAQSLFNTIRTTNGMRDNAISRLLTEQKYSDARDWVNGNINGWIIEEAGHSQVPALTRLLGVPERLQFLQELAAHRQKFPAPTSDGRKPDALVARILVKGLEAQTATVPAESPRVETRAEKRFVERPWCPTACSLVRTQGVAAVPLIIATLDRLSGETNAPTRRSIIQGALWDAEVCTNIQFHALTQRGSNDPSESVRLRTSFMVSNALVRLQRIGPQKQ